jgi:hypothetical protein
MQSSSRLVLILFLATTPLLAYGCSDTGSSTPSGDGGVIGAWVMAQQFVEDHLKAPSTADFGSVFGDYQDPRECVTKLEDGGYVCRGWVDAENSFGANIRTRFVCVVRYLGDDRWRLESFEFK